MEEPLKCEFKEKVLENVQAYENVQQWWEINSMVITKAGEEILDRTMGRKPCG